MRFFTVLAHEGEEALEVVGPSLSEIIRSNQINFTLASVAAVFILTMLAVIFSKVGRKPQAPPIPSSPQVVTPPVQEAEMGEENGNALWKTFLFSLMVLVILANSAYLVSSTLYVNLKSVTGGPVHWHAHFEVWDCGAELDLVDPKHSSDEVGSSLFHEHNDKQIHVEGAVFDPRNISLGAFFIVVGGDLDPDYLKFPTNDGVVERKNDALCPDGKPGTLQVFLYKTRKDGSFTQQKLTNPQNYVLTPEPKVPPGDCIIVEFSSEIKDQTDKLCKSYQVAKEKNSHGR